MRDAKVLRTLILLDLDAHPPGGDAESGSGFGCGIDVVEVDLDVTPGRIVHRITSYNVCYTKLLRKIQFV